MYLLTINDKAYAGKTLTVYQIHSYFGNVHSINRIRTKMAFIFM